MIEPTCTKYTPSFLLVFPNENKVINWKNTEKQTKPIYEKIKPDFDFIAKAEIEQFGAHSKNVVIMSPQDHIARKKRMREKKLEANSKHKQNSYESYEDDSILIKQRSSSISKSHPKDQDMMNTIKSREDDLNSISSSVKRSHNIAASSSNHYKDNENHDYYLSSQRHDSFIKINGTDFDEKGCLTQEETRQANKLNDSTLNRNRISKKSIKKKNKIRGPNFSKSLSREYFYRQLKNSPSGNFYDISQKRDKKKIYYDFSKLKPREDKIETFHDNLPFDYDPDKLLSKINNYKKTQACVFSRSVYAPFNGLFNTEGLNYSKENTTKVLENPYFGIPAIERPKHSKTYYPQNKTEYSAPPSIVNLKRMLEINKFKSVLPTYLCDPRNTSSNTSLNLKSILSNNYAKGDYLDPDVTNTFKVKKSYNAYINYNVNNCKSQIKDKNQSLSATNDNSSYNNTGKKLKSVYSITELSHSQDSNSFRFMTSKENMENIEKYTQKRSKFYKKNLDVATKINAQHFDSIALTRIPSKIQFSASEKQDFERFKEKLMGRQDAYLNK